MILITGATGLLGSHLMAHLIVNKQRMRCLKRESSSMAQVHTVLQFYDIAQQDYEQSVEWCNGDLSDTESLTQAMDGVSILYHCAADVNMGGVVEEDMRRINVEGTERVVQIAKQAGVETLCYVSSIAALGNEPNNQYISEHSPWDGAAHHEPYAQSKYDAQQIVMAAQKDGMNVVIVNPGPILGVSCHNASSAKIIYLAKKGIPFSTHGGTGYVDVRDVCRAMIQLVEKKVYGECFVLVGFNASNHELLSSFMKAFGHISPIPLPRWLVMSAATVAEGAAWCFGKKIQLNRAFARTALRRSWYDNSKLCKAIDFTFIPMETTVKDIAQFMKNKI